MLGEEDADTAHGYTNLAHNLTWQRKYKEAQPLCQTALAIRRKVLGDEHLDTAESHNNLALNLARLQGSARGAAALPGGARHLPRGARRRGCRHGRGLQEPGR